MSISGWLLASNALFFVFSTLAIVASIAVFLLTRANDREKDRQLVAQQATTEGKVAEAKTAGIEAGREASDANVEAARANEQAALANERAAALEREAAQLRAQLQERTHPLVRRRLTEEQSSSLESLLKGSNIMVGLFSSTNDPEARRYADDFSKVLTAAGVLGPVASGMISEEDGRRIQPGGIQLVGNDTVEKSLVENALVQAKIECGIARKFGFIVLNSGMPTIVVGERPDLSA